MVPAAPNNTMARKTIHTVVRTMNFRRRSGGMPATAVMAHSKQPIVVSR
jgi:hypothetical protein